MAIKNRSKPKNRASTKVGATHKENNCVQIFSIGKPPLPKKIHMCRQFCYFSQNMGIRGGKLEAKQWILLK